MLSESDRQAAAEALRAAEANKQPMDPLRSQWPDIDVVDAYEIQLRNIAHRTEAGALVTGHKVGLSSKAMQEMVGVDEPDYGHLLDDMFLFEDTETPADRYCMPRVEVEVGFVLGAPLSGPGCSVADVLRATDYVLPCIELIDSRIKDWKIALVDTVADNASSAGIVAGGRVRAPTPSTSAPSERSCAATARSSIRARRERYSATRPPRSPGWPTRWRRSA